MEVTAIVYNSNAGHTARYAALLSEKTGLPCYNLDTAKTELDKNAKVVFLGWLMAGIVKGYKKAKKRYDVQLTVGVGMAPPSDAERARLSKQNGVDISRFEMLLGGYEYNKLHGVYKFMMGCMEKAIKKGMSKKTELTDDEKMMLDMAVNGRDCVCEENLAPVLALIEK